MWLLNSIFVLKIGEGLWKPGILLRAIQSVTFCLRYSSVYRYCIISKETQILFRANCALPFSPDSFFFLLSFKKFENEYDTST